MVESIKELRKICYESREGEIDWWARNVSTRISIYITKLLLHTPVTANQVTLSMIVVGLTASVLFSFGNYWYSIIGGLLLHFAIILDGVDGEIARYRKKTSITGEYIDRLYHNIVPPFLFAGISFGVYNNFPNIMVFVFGFSASLFILLLRTIDLEKFKLLSNSGSKEEVYEEALRKIYPSNILGRAVARIVNYAVNHNIALLPAGTKIFANVVFIGAVFNCMHLVLIIYGVAMPCQWIWKAHRNINTLFT